MRTKSLKDFPSRVKVGSYNEEQILDNVDKRELELAKKKTGFKFTVTRITTQKGVKHLDIYLVSNEDYLNSSEI